VFGLPKCLTFAHKKLKMPNPTPPVANIEAHIAATEEQLRTTVQEPKSYQVYWRQFQAFVDRTPQLINGPPYLTRANIDTFFLVDVAKRTVCGKTVGKILPALVWYSRHREHINESFSVESEMTKRALAMQKELVKTTGGSGKAGQDPHLGLKDNMSTYDRLLIMSHIYGSRKMWGPESFAFTWGNNAAVRGDSDSKFVLADLRVSHGYGAEEQGGLSRSLIVVLRRGQLHKDRHDTDDQVAVWRHKEPKLCAVLSTALHVLSTLKADPDIHFHHHDKDKRAPWWDKPILQWKSKTGMSWCSSVVLSCKQQFIY
jgi:hypothetical protein